MSIKTYSYTVIIQAAEPQKGGFWVQVPALPGCFSQGQTVEECIDHAREAIATHVQGLAKLGQDAPIELQRPEAFISSVRVNVPLPA
jgi:predicted RNase H-like HicB family nuclease